MPSTIPIQATVRKPCGERALRCGSGRRHGRHAVAGFRRRTRCRISQSTITSAPTKSTTSPWIRSVRFEASSGWKIVGIEVAGRRAVDEAREEQRREPDADGRVAPEQRDRDPDEGDRARRDVARRDVELPAEDVERSGEAGERAGDRHREEVVARDADAAVAGRLGVEADRLDAVAERRPVEDEPVDDERGDRDEEADVRPWKSGSPQKTGSFAPATMSFEIGTNACLSFCSGPPRPNRNTPTQIAIQLSMIVEITSCAPTVAFRKPAIPAQSAPQSVATTIARTTWRNGFRP